MIVLPLPSISRAPDGTVTLPASPTAAMFTLSLAEMRRGRPYDRPGRIVKAAVAGLDDPEIPRRIRAKYKRRLEKLVATLKRCGFQCEMPGGTYFLYTPSPKGVAGRPGDSPAESGVTFENAEACSQYLITQQSICTVPWDDAGAFLRFSVTYEAVDEAAEDALMAETEARLKGIQPIF